MCSNRRRSFKGSRQNHSLSPCGRGLGRVGSRTITFQQQNQRPLRYLVAELDLHFLDHATIRRRHIHCRLVSFQRYQIVFGFNRIADFHHHFDDAHIFVVADVRHHNLLYACTELCRSICHCISSNLRQSLDSDVPTRAKNCAVSSRWIATTLPWPP